MTVDQDKSPSRVSAEKRALLTPVLDYMRQINVSGISSALDVVAKDSNAGIAIAHLEGAVTTVDGEYHFHAARVFPGDGNFVNPHWHEVGEEPYLILAGEDGEINLGRMVDGKVVWDEPRAVQAGEMIIVEEGQIHSLRNKGGKSYDFLFACPASHLSDKSTENKTGDRQFAAKLRPGTNVIDLHVPNGIPPHYPVKIAE
jgi:mannose-6-phosphate isomerase-like protein (cupin superfamily)